MYALQLKKQITNSGLWKQDSRLKMWLHAAHLFVVSINRVLFFSTEKLVSKVVIEQGRTGRNRYTQFRTFSKTHYYFSNLCRYDMKYFPGLIQW